MMMTARPQHSAISVSLSRESLAATVWSFHRGPRRSGCWLFLNCFIRWTTVNDGYRLRARICPSSMSFCYHRTRDRLTQTKSAKQIICLILIKHINKTFSLCKHIIVFIPVAGRSSLQVPDTVVYAIVARNKYIGRRAKYVWYWMSKLIKCFVCAKILLCFPAAWPQ